MESINHVLGMVQQDVYEEGEKKKADKKPIGTEMVLGDILLAELLISLPKPAANPPKPLKKAPLTIKPEG